MARLKIRFRGAETVVSLVERETTVGRSNRCTIHLPDPDLAPVHFRIRARDRGYQLKDDGSGIGTRVNGKPVYATTLGHGDVIRAGGLECVFLEKVGVPEPPPQELPASRPPAARRGPALATWLWIGLAVAVAGGAAFFLLRESPETKAQALWAEANRLREAAETDPAHAEERLAEAADLLERVRREFAGTNTARTAAANLIDVRRVLDALARLAEEKAGLRDDLADDELDRAFVRLGRARQVAHPAVEARARDVEEGLRQVRTGRLERAFDAVRDRARTLLEERRFGDASAAWRAYEPADYVYRQRAEEAREAMRARIAEEYRGLLRLAGRNEDLDGRIGLLEASRPVFAGTRHADDLEVRIGALRARRQALTVLEKPPERRTEPEEKEPGEAPLPPPAEYEEPPHVADLVRRRRYAEAASALGGISRHPDARIRIEELTLLANLMADLAAAIGQRPADFTRIRLPGGGRGDAVGADGEALRVRVDGEERAIPWAELPADAFDRLLDDDAFTEPPRIAAALFFDEEGLAKEADRRWAAYHRSEQDPALLTRILARRRGIAPPEAGFELFRGRLVTRAEREAILLAEQVEKLGKQARSPVASRRRAAIDELTAIGEPARETLAAVLTERRAEVARELEESPAFRPARFVARLGKELEQRRKDALAFILDANRYPYPNKTEASQKEAERLVDLVRDLWERPYAALLARSDDAQALDRELADLDERLARLEPLAEPMREVVERRIQEGLDVATIALDSSDRKRIDHYFAVLEYNRTVETTADEEERANVLAVNEYRHMMGLHAVKIDERLVRAARKHSIEMRQLDYFDHNSPTAHLKTPSHRAKREGYGGGVAENIARGAGTGREAFWQWFRSSGHHRNMLNPGHTEMGCGAAAHHWWTQKFGRLTGRNLDPPRVPPDPDPPGTSGNGMPAPG